MKFTLHRRAKRAFTLVEILVVIAIIAILAALTVRVYDSVTQSQNKSRALADMATISAALEAFKGQYGDYPRLNARDGAENCARTLFKCLAGQSYIETEKGQIKIVDVKNTSDYKPLLDISIMRIGDPSNPDEEVTNIYNDKNAFLDPWGRPYLYYYNTSNIVGSTGSWEGTGFILMSSGDDGESADVQSMLSIGIMPKESDFRSNPKNVDNIVHNMD